ncbi:hypothetical protein PGB90_000464 [Kerria lacca]
MMQYNKRSIAIFSTYSHQNNRYKLLEKQKKKKNIGTSTDIEVCTNSNKCA